MTTWAKGYTLEVEEYQIAEVEARGMSPRGKEVLRWAQEVLGPCTT